MKKFNDARAPLTMLKVKMKILADKNEAFNVFRDELEQVCAEQSKFFDKVEYDIALAETIDPLQAILHSSFTNVQ